MSSYPDGPTEIPQQTAVPGVGPHPAGDDARAASTRRTAVLMRAAAVNGVLITAAVVAVYVLELVEPDVGVWLILGAAFLGSAYMFVVIMGMQRRQARARAAGVGAGPLASVVPDRADPYGAVAGGGVPASPTGGFALTVEDVFSITGRGTVVTGRVEEGSIAVGEQVTVVRDGAALGQVEVTGVEMFRKLTDRAQAGDNVGLLLPGVRREDMERGDRLVA